MEDNQIQTPQEKFCICCGRPQSMVPLMMEGNFGNICSDCVNHAYNVMKEQTETVSENLMKDIPKPHDIKKFLDQYIIGQDRVKELAARHGSRFEGQRHQHVIFPEIEQIAVGLEQCEHEAEQADGQRAQHRRGVDHAIPPVAHAHGDTECHHHPVQAEDADGIPHDAAALLFIGGVPVDVPPARGQEQRLQ